MQIDQLLKPIEPPPGGLMKLQQAIKAKHGHRPFQSWRWQTAVLCAVGLIWFGSQMGGLDSPGQKVDLTVTAMELALDGTITAAPSPQSQIAELPSSDTKVKMYWLMADG